jgi:hypothetical protein
MKSCERNLLCGIFSIGCEYGSDKLLLKSFQILLIIVQLSFAFVEKNNRSLKLDWKKDEYKSSQAFLWSLQHFKACKIKMTYIC